MMQSMAAFQFLTHKRDLFVGRWALVIGLMIAAFPAYGYEEAPMLAERVAKGELPPVDQRLPKDPAIVEPIHTIGKYGGAWRRIAVGTVDFHMSARLGYESLVRWDRTGRAVTAGLADRWDVLKGGRTYVFHLREGLRWSDGAPFTSEDLMFAYEDVYLNKELSPVFPDWLIVDGTPVEISAPDAYTVQFHFTKPNGIFLELMAFRGIYLYMPKHYLKQFHPKYTDQKEIERKAAERGMPTWYSLFGNLNNTDTNPELPTLKPFVMRTSPTALRVICERNPYYWKVDPEGNQLPYLDAIAFTVVQNAEILNMKAMAGEADFQDRRIDSANYPLFMENRAKGHYRVIRDPNPTPIVLYINQCSRDETLRPLLQDRRFRVALSVAVNRRELIDLIYSGMATPSRGVASRFDPFYLPEFEQKYIQYDPGLANQLLDEVGLLRGLDGMRRMSNGQPFRHVLNVYPSETGTPMELWQLVADYYREVGLDFAVKTDAPSLSMLQAMNGNSDFWGYATTGMHWIVDPVWFVPVMPNSYFAPLFGRYIQTNGKGGVKLPEEYQRLVDWYYELRSVVDNEPSRLELGRRILGQWSEECYTVGICTNELLTIVSNRFKNVPDHIIHDYRVMTPGYIGIEQFYIDEES